MAEPSARERMRQSVFVLFRVLGLSISKQFRIGCVWGRNRSQHAFHGVVRASADVLSADSWLSGKLLRNAKSRHKSQTQIRFGAVFP